MNTQMLAATLSLSALLAGCGVADVVPVAEQSAEDVQQVKHAEVNICDGEIHQFGDVMVQVTGCKLQFGRLDIAGTMENASEGAVFPPIKDIEVVDEFGNTASMSFFKSRSAFRHLSPGESQEFSASYYVKNKEAGKYLITFRIMTHKTPDSRNHIRSVPGEFSPELPPDSPESL